MTQKKKIQVRELSSSDDCKARGAFFTPPVLADFLAQWAIRTGEDRVLEPSCGDAAFLLPAGKRLVSLSSGMPSVVYGTEIHDASARASREVLANAGIESNIETGDFFSVRPPVELYDAVIGNPPYVRYQDFSGSARARALEAALRQGVRLSGLASSWAPFVVHASAFLNANGRMAMVLPAELLSVNYAVEVRRFLLRRFASVKLVLFEEIVFPGVLEEVVLLMAEGTGGADCFEVFQARNANELASIPFSNWRGYTPIANEKWTTALLEPESLDLYRKTTASPDFEVLLDWGNTYLGAVTGANGFFALSVQKAKELGLRDSEVRRISPPGSRHLRGLEFSEASWKSLASDGADCLLFAPEGKLSASARRYIESGERAGVQKAYKCKVRDPWWKVPLVQRPDFLFSYMNHDRPRITRNGANVEVLNSLYGIRLHQGRKTLGKSALHIASLNSITLLGAEVVGRSYGGGMLKHEPKEADMLPMPSEALLKDVAPRLELLRPQISAALRGADISAAVEMVDRVLLWDGMKLPSESVSIFRAAREALFSRRRSRGRGYDGSN